MSTTSVYNALHAAIQNNSIDLWTAANGSPDLMGLVPVLGLFRIDTSYMVTSVVLTTGANGASVILTGFSSFVSDTSYPVNVTMTYLQSNNSFTLALAVKTAWIFSDFFANLPNTLMQDPAMQRGVTWYPSVLTGMQINSAVFTGKTADTTLNLTGFLAQPDNAYLLSKTPMIGPWPLRLSGTVEMPTGTRNYPLIDLDARGNNTNIIGNSEPGIHGPSPIALQNPGLHLIVQPLAEEQLGNVAFSTIRLFANFALGDIVGRISTLILSTGDTWNFSVQFSKNATLVHGLAQLTKIFGVELPIPMNFPVLKDFYVSEVDIDLQITSGSGLIPSFSLQNLAITIRSEKTWVPPIPFVTLNNVGTRWVWGWTYINGQNGQEKTYTLTGSVFGTFNFGGSSSKQIVYTDDTDPFGTGSNMLLEDSTDPVSIDVSMSLPDFMISGGLATDSVIPIGDALHYFFGNDGPSIGPQDMNVTRLRFTADPIGQNYFANASILFTDPLQPDKPDAEQGWEINLIILTIILNELEFNISVNNGRVSGGISGIFYLQQGSASDYNLPRIMISAEYPPQDPDNPQGWTLMGYLYPGTSISLTDLVYQFIYGKQTTPPDWIPDVTVDRLAVKFTTGAMGSNGVAVNPSYQFGGTVSARWQPAIFGTTLKVSASASVDLEKTATATSASGKITGTFSVNRIALTASLTFGVPEPTYLFKVQFDQIWLQATTSWRGAEANRHQVVSLQLGGVTLGDMLEYLVNLAAPTIGFSLDSPWDVLKKIDLSRFVLTLDPKENVVEFVFEANVDLVIAQIKTIGVRYTKNKNQGSVNLILTGSFLGQSYTPENPLEWDVINDPPPAVPGQGISLVKLKYLGLGQHVTFKGAVPDTVSASIDMLKRDMTKPPADGNPMPQTMRYSTDSQWLIGLDIELMETVGLKFIFNDPVLYGLSVALGGERAGSLAGLKFEILYKKITDDIGMFRVEFQVPDMFSTIQLGVVSITLGIIVVEIYTNGNFKVDLGFPYNQDFSRSFSLQAYVFIGRGGFYLGVLNGDTSTQVPKISNGNFSPVIELGIGIAAGVGREIREGILSGGAYIELQVIFQGVLAWFNPNSSGIAPATYFKCHGIAALHGKVYGSVDFVVVKVSITLEAYAQVSIIYESYQPMQIIFSVEVSAEASVKILFVRIHFSFDVKLEMGFTLGTAEPTPWILSENNSSDPTLKTATKSAYALRSNPARKMQTLRRHYSTQMRASMAHARFAANTTALADTDYQLNWNPSAPVFSDSPRNAHVTMLPIFTIGDVPVNWGNTTPANSAPNYRSAFVLFADTGMDPTAQTASQLTVRSSEHSGMTLDNEDTSLLAADILTQGLVHYAINSLPRPSTQGNILTAHDITLLLIQLDLPEAMSDGLSIANLATFFNTNIHLWISGDADPRPDEKSAMVIPMPPFLNWTSEQAGDVDFSTKNKIGTLYEWQISQLLNTYFPVGDTSGPEPTDDDPANYESFTSFMFRDFCLLLMQNGMKEMQKLLQETSVTVTTVGSAIQTLSQVASTLPTVSVSYTIHAGDTIESVAESLGATVEELEFLNPALADSLDNDDVGTELTIILGIPPQTLAIDNADKLFAINELTLGTIVHQANTNDTLQIIADLFHIPNSVASPSVAVLLSYHSDDYISLSSGPNILKPLSTFALPAQVFMNAPAGYTRQRTAAVFFVRYMNYEVLKDTLVPDMANWYIQAITSVSANETRLQSLFPGQPLQALLELPPGLTLSVPDSFQAAYLTAGNCNDYTTVAGDTLGRIGYSLVFEQDATATTSIASWQTFLTGVTAGTAANSWNIPAQTNILIESGQTFESLVRRLILNCTWTGSDVNNPAEGTWSYDWISVSNAWAAHAVILEPLACITVPDAKTSASMALSFAQLSSNYGISITDAATRLKDVSGLYASGTILLVKLLPAQDITVLMTGILQGNHFASIVNQSSRMLMSGLQLPDLKTENGHTVMDTAHPLPLYDLTGQQFSVAVDPAAPTEVALALSLQSEQPWIQLFDSMTVEAGQTLAELQTTYPDLMTYNPGLSAATFQMGMVLLVAIETSLEYSYTNADIETESPASGLMIQPVPPTLTAPAALALSGTVPRTYGLEHRIELQSPIALAIPTSASQMAVTGNAGAWLLPNDLLTKARLGVTTLYELLSAPLGGNAGNESIEIESSTFGLLLPFKVKRMDDANNNFNLLGVDTDNRPLLISLMNWLSSTNTASAYLMLSPAPNAGNTSGLTVLNIDPDNAFLIKSNLSTTSMPPAFSARGQRLEEEPVVDSAYYASFSQLQKFIKLLWEGTVVGGTGYYFNAGQSIPGSAFDEQGNITLQLLVIANSQQSLVPNGRSLLPFNNCALVGAGIDTAQLSLFIQSAGSTDPSEVVVQALVPPGNVGFDLLLANPGDATDPQTRLKNLYSLLSYRIASVSGSPFVATASGMPVLPSPSDDIRQATWQKQRASRLKKKQATANTSIHTTVMDGDEAQPYWRYTQVMPVSKFTAAGTVLAAPNVVGLPLYTNDPYIGYGTQTVLPTASFVFGFGDVLGNRSGANSDQQGVTGIKVGYTDNMIGISDWPSIARYYTVQAAGSTASLNFMLSLRPSELLPTPSQRGDVLATQLIQQQQRFAQIYYQLVQPDLQAWAVSSLNYVADADYGNKGQAITDLSPLWKFAAGAYTITSGLIQLSAAKPVLPSRLDAVIATYHVRYTELAQANAEGLIDDLFGTELPAVPAYLAYVENQTITGMFGLAPKGWPLPSDALALLSNDENSALPLKTGLSLVIPVKTMSTGSISPSVSMKALADANNTSVASLALQNKDKAVLQTGFEFTVDIDETTEAVVTVSGTVNSFSLVVAAFAEQGVNIDVVGLCDVNQDKPDMFALNESITTTFYIVKADDTLSTNDTGESVSDLAAANLTTPNLFDPGALVFFNPFDNVAVDNTTTLRQLASRYGCSMEQIVAFNGTFTLPAGSGFVLPGTLAFPTDKSALTVPYTIRTGDALNTIAPRFAYNASPGTASLQLANANANMPGTLVPNTSLSIAVGGTSYTVNTGSGTPSFNSLLTSLQQAAPSASMADVVAAIGTGTTVLNAGGLFICPLCQFTANTAPSGIEALYGVSASSFALANTAIQNLIVTDSKLYAPDGVKFITTKTNDTFNSIITSFADEEVTVTAGDVVNANPTVAFIASGALAFIPPASLDFTVTLPQNAMYEGPVVPLQVSLRLIRPEALIPDEFKTPKGTGPVEMTESDFPAPLSSSVSEGSLSLNDFVSQISTAIDTIRIGTGKVSGIAQDLWQVNFNAQGISQVELIPATQVNSAAQPRFFALTPLYKHLVNRTVSIAPLLSTGSLGTAQDISFQSVDTELWARRFVEDMDRFLSGGYATAIYTNPAIQDYLDAVLRAKQNLIPKIAAGLNTVLSLTDSGAAAGLVSATESLKQQLGISLTRAYEANALVQYNSSVQSPYVNSSSLLPASLYGEGALTNTEAGQVISGLSIISAKTDLSLRESFVNFLVMLDNPAFHRTVAGTFTYDISNLEFNMTGRNLPDNYKASDWLSFVPLLTHANKPDALLQTDPAGTVNVPIPLRNFPDLPKIVKQEAAQSYRDEKNLAVSDLSLWDYGYTYSHQHAEQDYVLITAEFNLSQPHVSARAISDPRDLFTELAQYVSVADGLWNMLNGLTDPAAKTAPAAIANAVETYAGLVTNISQYWSARLPQAANVSPTDALVADMSYLFNARVTYRNEFDIDTYTLTLKETLHPTLVNKWPDVYVQTQVLGFDTWVQIPLDSSSTIEAVYRLPGDITIFATAWPVFKLEWTKLNVATVQNARSKMSVERNQNLVDHVNTNPAFIFATDTVVAPSVVTPLNSFGRPVDITSLGTDLTTALTACFTGLFGTGYSGKTVTMELSYGYELVAPDQDSDGLVTYLPIGLYPNQTLSATTAQQLSTATADWKRINQPVETGGEWVFSLKLYSQLTENTQTLLNVEHLFYKMS